MLYIEATNTVITDPGQRYTHPDTGEVYGGTDYNDPAKLAEIGAVPLRIEQPDTGFDTATWEIVDDPENKGGKLKRPATTTPWTITPADLATKVNAVVQERDRRMELLTVSYNDWTIVADSKAIANLTSIVSAMTAGVPIGEVFPWPDASGAVQMLTPTQLVELGGVMLAATLPLYTKSWTLNGTLAAITNPVVFRTVDVTADEHWVTEVTGPTGSEVTGPTGSEVTGPTGSEVTGPTGSEVTGPTGSEVTGPTGS